MEHARLADGGENGFSAAHLYNKPKQEVDLLHRDGCTWCREVPLHAGAQESRQKLQSGHGKPDGGLGGNASGRSALRTRRVIVQQLARSVIILNNYATEARARKNQVD